MQIKESFEDFTSAFEVVLPYLRDIIGQDIAVNISNTTHFLGFQDASTFHLPVTPGSEIPLGDPMLETIKQGVQLMANVPGQVYGVPMKAITTPLISDGKVVGCIGVGRSIAVESQVSEMAVHLENSLQQVSAAIQQIAVTAGSVNEDQQMLGSAVTAIGEATIKINSILEFIKNIADQTKMLGLNAAIEAARAGDAGKGFGVVAEEIRKLSDESRQTVNQIRDLSKGIEESVQVATKFSVITLKATEEQAAVTEEITAHIEELSSSAQVLEDVAKTL